MGSHENYQDLVSIYALGALPEVERKQFEGHLVECKECQTRLAQELVVVQMMPRAVEPIEPSSDTKRKLFARVDEDLAPQSATAVATPAVTTAEITRGVTEPQLKGSEKRQGWFARPVFAFAVIAVLALLALAIWVVPGMMQTPEERTIAAILNDPNVQQVALGGTPDAPDAKGEMFMVPGHSQAVLMVSGLSELPPNQGYEFWFFRDGVPQPSNVFTVNPDGSRTVLVEANDTVENFRGWGVTIEPKEGVPAPTGPIVMVGGL